MLNLSLTMLVLPKIIKVFPKSELVKLHPSVFPPSNVESRIFLIGLRSKQQARGQGWPTFSQTGQNLDQNPFESRNLDKRKQVEILPLLQ